MTNDEIEVMARNMEKVIREQTKCMVGKVITKDIIGTVSNTVTESLNTLCKRQIKFEVVSTEDDQINVKPKNNFTADLLRGLFAKEQG